MKRVVYSIVGTLIGVASLGAQESSPVSFQIGTGFTQAVGRAGTYTDAGWTVSGGAGYNFTPNVGLMVDLGYTSLGINSTALAGIGVPGGNVNIFSATLDPIVHLNPHGHLDVYLTGGGGLYHRYQDFTAPTVATAYGFNPYFGFYPTVVPATQILASYTTNKPGFDVGIGISMGTKWHGKIYAEARYNEIFSGNNYYTGYLPVTFGFRW